MVQLRPGRSGPMTPAEIHSQSRRVSSEAWRKTATCVATPDFLRRLGHQPGGVERVGHRLLAVDVLALLHRGDGGRGVQDVGRAHHDGVDVLLPVEHLAVVGERGAAARLARPASVGR